MWIIEVLDYNGVWIFSHACSLEHNARRSVAALERKGIRARMSRG